uniref:Uncharacterized protein n=1 Tax=mine drainage metagenome TaxID=410659 RepID=E6QR07_9ZZZZ
MLDIFSIYYFDHYEECPDSELPKTRLMTVNGMIENTRKNGLPKGRPLDLMLKIILSAYTCHIFRASSGAINESPSNAGFSNSARFDDLAGTKRWYACTIKRKN